MATYIYSFAFEVKYSVVFLLLAVLVLIFEILISLITYLNLIILLKRYFQILPVIFIFSPTSSFISFYIYEFS